MKKKIITLYSFNELPEESKKKVIERYRDEISADSNSYDWEDLWSPSISKFEKIFNVKLNISDKYGWGHDIKIDDGFHYHYWGGMDRDSIELGDLSGIQLLRYIGDIFRNYCEKGKYYSTGGKFEEVDGKQEYRYKKRYSKIMKEWDSCPLTGTCGDYPILLPIAQYLNLKKGGYGFRNEDGSINRSWKYYTYMDIMEACADSMIEQIEQSEEYNSSDEHIAEMIENRYDDKEYLENGDEFDTSMELEDFVEVA